ncbi:MAG: DNA polymerase domain-containing protein [Thermoplasmata archaeon]
MGSSGWLLDITEDRAGTGVVLWLKSQRSGRVVARREPFRPAFWVTGPRDGLARLEKELTARPDVDQVERRTARPSLFDRRPRTVLSVRPRRNFARRRLAGEVDALGNYHEFTLYDVDLSAPQLYHLTHGLYPFAPVTWTAEAVTATEPAETIDYDPPPLRGAELTVELVGHRRGRIPPTDGRIEALVVGPARLEGGEAEMLAELPRELARQDPDLLTTDGGDAFDLPWLYRRAVASGLTEEVFFLGREPVLFRSARPARSFETYGRILHVDATFPLAGRFHVDRSNSFLYDDASIDGLIEAARLSRLSLQTVVRQSPGTCFTAMEMAHALAEDVHIPWKKNRPEEFKSGRQLVAADRGGVLFLPPVGVHDHVDEFDFASLYPHIMVRQNLSTETLNCRCCPRSPKVAPGLGYRSCVRRVGLIPRTLTPLLIRRLAYKRRLKAGGLPLAEAQRLTHRTKMLKWVLVTAFGYQGYRNARFGRIECHEAINAYARDLIVRLIPEAERVGYRVVHGLVDSLWLVPERPDDPPDAELFARRMSELFDLPLTYEGRYRWVVFLPAVTHGLGVPNRYYGLYASGEFKLRGIGVRRHDTPMVIRRFEQEVLNALSRAKDADGVRALLPRLLARADLFAEALRAGRWPREELLIAHRLIQAPASFVTFTDTLAAARQLAAEGVDRAPGETVRYVVQDRSSRSWRDRVKVAELLDEAPYDRAAYLELLARSAETLLAPLGVRRADLLARWKVAPPPPRGRYRSPEGPSQSRLDTGRPGEG